MLPLERGQANRFGDLRMFPHDWNQNGGVFRLILFEEHNSNIFTNSWAFYLKNGVLKRQNFVTRFTVDW